MNNEYISTGSIVLDYSKVYLFGIKLAFVDLNNYQSLMETFLETAKINHEGEFDKDKIEAVAKSYHPHEFEYRSYLEEQYFEAHFELSELYPHNFRASYLIL
jgi:hypothetical protein